MSITVYGIKNCSSMKKAFDKLTELGVAYEFIDYKKTLIDAATFDEFVKTFGVAQVINKKGTTYRKFSDADKAVVDAAIDDESAANIMAVYEIIKENLSVIKRPIIIGSGDDAGKVAIGFDADEIGQVFG